MNMHKEGVGGPFWRGELMRGPVTSEDVDDLSRVYTDANPRPRTWRWVIHVL